MEKTVAKVFMNGRSQAIRLPKEFRVTGDEVFIMKQKDKIVLAEKPQKTLMEIANNMPAFPEFDVNKKAVRSKPRGVKL